MTDNTKTVSVIAPARLHMGFMDLSGALGRNYGSVGLALSEICTRLTLTSSSQLHAQGPAAERVYRYTQDFCRKLNVSDHVSIAVESAIPEHVGLGSGTQLALAIGSALNAYYDLGLSVREIANIGKRGMRSGIGIGVFEKGGLVVDGGRGENSLTPPMISHMKVPEDWRFILVFDRRGQGFHGQQEISAFKKLPSFSQQEAARLCYLLMMRGLPAVAEKDIAKFGEVISELQRTVGQHFAAVQGGVFTSPEVAQVMHWLQQQGAVAIGQTSWGPTGFCALADKEKAHALVNSLTAHNHCHDYLSFKIVSARNTSANVFIS